MDKIFRALNSKLRRDILRLLRDEEMTPIEISDRLQVGKSYMSQQLAILREAGLVSTYKARPYVFYKTDTATIRVLQNYLNKLG